MKSLQYSLLIIFFLCTGCQKNSLIEPNNSDFGVSGQNASLNKIPDFLPLNYVNIVPQHSKKVLDTRIIISNLRPVYDLLTQQERNSSDSQKFLFFKMDADKYVIASKYTGKVLDVEGASKKKKTLVHQHPYHGKNNQLVIYDQNSRLIDVNSNMAYDVRGESKKNSAVVQIYPQHNKDNQRFIMESAEAIVPRPRSSTIKKLDVPPQYDFYGQVLKDSEPIVTGETYMPYIMIGDDLDAKTAAKESPYYLLRKESYWHRVRSFTHSGKTKKTETITHTTGLTEKETKTFEAKVNIKLASDSKFNFFGFVTKNLATTITGEINTKTTNETTRMTSTVRVIEIVLDKGPAFSQTEWILVEKYSLFRSGGVNNQGVLVDAWSVTVDEVRSQSYIDENGTTQTTYKQPKLISKTTLN